MTMTDGADSTMAQHDDASRPPVVMQVLPSLVTGGVERGAVDIAVGAGGCGLAIDHCVVRWADGA